MVRISDGRMSGTGFGTVILHASPEAALGGNFAVVKTGDINQPGCCKPFIKSRSIGRRIVETKTKLETDS